MKPNYNKSILSVSSSILKHYGIKSNYKSLNELDIILKKNYKNIVFLILDCLGENIVNQNLTDKDILKNNVITTVTSVFPQTTAAATTAFHSGLSPYESGWIGWMPYYKEYDRMIELFLGTDFYTGKKIPGFLENNDLNYKTIYEKICEKNTNIKYTKLFPSFEKNGSKTFEELCNKIKIVCENNSQNLISAYWDEPDYTIHHNGTSSKITKDVVRNINKTIEKLSKELKDTLIIISADHGAIDVKEVYLNEVKEIDKYLSKPPSIESRFVSFFIKEGKQNEFYKSFTTKFKDKYKLYTKQEFIDKHLLGKGKKHNRIDSYLGDYIFISESTLAIRYTTTETKQAPHLADHAGITKDEMIVPVIAIECK